eukprot:scaffold75791_cov53-Phaeocystis_antarctica.AAC.1
MTHDSWLTPHGSWLMAHDSHASWLMWLMTHAAWPHDLRSTSRADGSEGCFQAGQGGGDQEDDDGCRPAGHRSLYELRRMRCGDDEGSSDEDDGEGLGLRALMEAEVP